MTSRLPTDGVVLAAAVLGVVAVEAVAAPGHPLDPVPRTGLALVATALLLGGLGGIGWLFGRHAGRPWSIPFAIGGWSVFAATEAAHLVGGNPWTWGLLAGPCMVLGAWKPRWAAGTIPLWALGLVLLRTPPDPAVSRTSETRLLLITVDTIRADTQLWEAAGLADQPGWFTAHAMAAAPWTPPSMVSLWLGSDVTEHGGGIELDGRISLPRQSMALGWPSRWAGAGFHPEAVVSNPYLRGESGFAEGFSAFWHADEARESHLLLHTLDASWQRFNGTDTHRGMTRDEQVTLHALTRLEAGVDVLWVHLLEPHEYDRRAEADDPEARRRAYAQAVADTGARISRLVDAAAGATVVVVGDHGESLGENQRWGHGRYPVAEVLEVPLAIRHAPTVATPPTAPATLPSLGAWLATLSVTPDVPYAGGALPTIAGIRGDPQHQYQWSPALRVAVPMPGAVVAGPPGALPDATVRDALEALGYLAGSEE